MAKRVERDLQREMWSAWSAADGAAREAGVLCDREEFDEVTYLMLVEARDLISKAMRREGFTDESKNYIGKCRYCGDEYWTRIEPRGTKWTQMCASCLQDHV